MDPFRTQEPVLRLIPRTPSFYIFIPPLSIIIIHHIYINVNIFLIFFFIFYLIIFSLS
jgi:hypothetical protein